MSRTPAPHTKFQKHPAGAWEVFGAGCVRANRFASRAEGLRRDPSCVVPTGTIPGGVIGLTRSVATSSPSNRWDRLPALDAERCTVNDKVNV